MIYAAGGIVHLRCGPPLSPDRGHSRSSTSQRLPGTAGCPRYDALPSSIPMITTSCQLPPLPVRHADQPRDPAAHRHDPREWHSTGTSTDDAIRHLQGLITEHVPQVGGPGIRQRRHSLDQTRSGFRVSCPCNSSATMMWAPPMTSHAASLW